MNKVINLIPEAYRKEFAAAAKAMKEDARMWRIVRNGEAIATIKGRFEAEMTIQRLANEKGIPMASFDIVEAK